MSKHKVTAGGYDDSSDGPEMEQVTVADRVVKKAKPNPVYAPPRLSATPKPGMGGFQLPQSKPRFSRDSSTPGYVTPPTSRLQPTKVPDAMVPDITIDKGNDHEMDEAPSGSEPEDVVSQGTDGRHIIDSKTRGEGLRPCSGRPLNPPKATSARSTLSLERQVNDLANKLEKYTESSDEQHRRADEKLTRLLEFVSRLGPGDVGSGQAPASRSASMSLVGPDAKPYLSNPKPTPELIAIISKVVSEARNRVGKKKGGADDNSMKEHARTTFYRMLNIQAAKSIRPYFEDEYGEPDTLPEQFIDPETKYCQPYPHWKAPLTKQAAWVPTYILRFRSTISNDQSDLSILLRNLSDEQIIVLLSDGPFKSAQTAWRDLKKTDQELEAMRSNARRYQRAERKSVMRAGYINLIPSLQGPDWEFLSHSGYMSQDESDDEGELITKRPEHRAQWATNLFEAIRVAELEKAKTRPGFSSNLPERNIESIRRPIPQLERGTGTGKFIVRIAACGLSRGWQDRHPDEFRKYVHLINPRVTAKPDISHFLAKYPMPSIGPEREDRNEVSEVNIGSESGEADDVIADFGSHAQEEDFVEMEDWHEKRGTFPAVDFPKVNAERGPTATLDHGIADIPIDPQILAVDSHGFAGQPHSGDHLRSEATHDTIKAHAVPLLAKSAHHAPPSIQSNPPLNTGTDWIAPEPVRDAHSPAHGQMPPPPPLPNESDTPIGDNTIAADGRKTRRRSRATPSSGATKVAAVAEPKKRGRPPGSKNKPKLAA